MGVFIPGSDSHRAGEAIAEVMKDEGWNIELVNLGHYEALDELKAGNIDLAITSNDLSIEKNGLHTLLPLYREVLIVLRKKQSMFRNINDSTLNAGGVRGIKPKIMLGVENSYDHMFTIRLLEYLNLDIDQLDLIFLPDLTQFENGIMDFIRQENPDYILNLLTLDSKIVNVILDSDMGYEMPGDENLQYEENRYLSLGAGFSLLDPRSEPFVIPERHFGEGQPYPLSSISLMDFLIVGNTMQDEAIYDFTSHLYNNRPYLTKKDPIFIEIDLAFDKRTLNFPIHKAVIDYIDRNEPTFYERYAELFGVIVSLSVILFGTIKSLNIMASQRKKDRVDKYVGEIMKIKAKGLNDETFAELEEIERKALVQLADEKLEANNAFLIFMMYLNSVKSEFHDIRKENEDEKII